MPIFEYHCLNCDENFEELVLSSSQVVKCPKCSQTRLEKLLSTCSYKSGGKFVSSSESKVCTTCSSLSCSTCH
ncbi:MAG TPA: zinc ribbon domain-containing protein [Syntrophaceae bacterium]|nr:zinc ribbon domain-containing protein [Syntrophaceae bacterium]